MKRSKPGKSIGLFKRLLICLGIMLLLSCVSQGNPVPGGTPGPESSPVPAAEDREDVILSRMENFLEEGRAQLSYGEVAQAVRQFVSVLAEHEAMEKSRDLGYELAVEARTELQHIEASLKITVEDQWINAAGQQVLGSSVEIFPQPALYLTRDLSGMGQALVADASVEFRFIKGSGMLTAFTKTNEYGQAVCKIIKLDNPMEESVIRAVPVFRVKGYEYRFDSVYRDFVYTPPSRRGVILVMERSPLGEASNPVIFDPVYTSLKDMTFDFSLYSGVLNTEGFDRIFNGDQEAIKELSLERDVSLMVVVLNECFDVRELEFNNKKLGMFISEARGILRIIRVSDGKILYQAEVVRQKSENTHGQGGSEKVAVKDALDHTAEAMGLRLKEEIKVITKAITGE